MTQVLADVPPTGPASTAEQTALLDGVELSRRDERARQRADARDPRPAAAHRGRAQARLARPAAAPRGRPGRPRRRDGARGVGRQALGADAACSSRRTRVVAFLVSLPVWVVVAKLYGLYDRDERRTDHSTADDFGGVFHIVTVCTFLFWALAALTGLAHPTAPKLVVFWAAAIPFVRSAASPRAALARRPIAYLQNAVIVGAGDVGQLVARKILQHPEYGINLVGFVDATRRSAAPTSAI